MFQQNRHWIDRFLAGMPVEYRPKTHAARWQPVERLGVFDTDVFEFRDGKDEIVVFCQANVLQNGMISVQRDNSGNLKLTFHGGKLEKAEVMPVEIYD